jgi:hypothetical protein
MGQSILLTMAAGVGCLLFCSMDDGVQEQAGPVVPQCSCTPTTPSWQANAACNTITCSQATLVSDSLSCTGSAYPNPCPITGSLTITLDSCTTSVCVLEYHLGCNASCPADTGERAPGTDPATPQLGACCLGPTGCFYTFEVRFYGTGTGCPASNLRCNYGHVFLCSS